MYRAQTLCKGRLRTIISVIANNTFIPITFKTDYAKTMRNYYVKEDAWENVYPTLMPQWDRTPRAGIKTNPLVNSTPEKFQTTVEQALQLVQGKEAEHQILFLKAWNEWGECNYVEPDQRFGHGYLNAIRDALHKYQEK